MFMYSVLSIPSVTMYNNIYYFYVCCRITLCLPALAPFRPYSISLLPLIGFTKEDEGIAFVSSTDSHILVKIRHRKLCVQIFGGIECDRTQIKFLELHLDLVSCCRRNLCLGAIPKSRYILRIHSPTVVNINELLRRCIGLEILWPCFPGNAGASRPHHQPVPWKIWVRETGPTKGQPLKAFDGADNFWFLRDSIHDEINHVLFGFRS